MGEGRRVRLVRLERPVLEALAAGDLAGANRAGVIPLPPFFVDPEWRRTWRYRSRQVAEDPSSAAWITGAIWDEGRRVAVGRAGFHGPRDGRGMVEVGYAVDPAWRRRGYARAALEAMLDRAAGEPAVRVVRASVGPENVASLALIGQYGFVAVGERWDEEDGLETIYEVGVG